MKLRSTPADPTFRRGWPAIALAVALILLAGCTTTGRAQQDVNPASDLAVAVLSSDLAVGTERLVLALRERTERRVVGGPLHLRLTPQPPTGAPALEATAFPRPSGGADIALYAAAVAFPRAGVWEVQVEAPSGRPEAPLTGSAVTEVHPTPATPAVGAPAPPVALPHLAAATPLAQRTSLAGPDAALYPADPAGAIGKGRPAVLTFAAPSVCPGGACAAQVAALSDLRGRFGDRLQVIHADPFPTQPLPAEPPAVVRAWNLHTQPWTFVIDGRGIIAARFEGFVGLEELSEAVGRVLARQQE